MGILSAFTAMLPAVYNGASARASADPTEYFLTCLHLLVNVGMACKDLVGTFRVLAAARGVAARVDALYGALAAPPPPRPPPAADEGGVVVLELKGLGVVAPDGAPLVRDLSLRLLKGQRLLLRGPRSRVDIASARPADGAAVACGLAVAAAARLGPPQS